MASFAYNNSKHSSTQMTPFYALYGYNPWSSIILLGDEDTPAASERLSYLSALQSYLVSEILQAQILQAKYADSRRGDTPQYSVGNLVWLLQRHFSTTRPSQKLEHCRFGPFKITRVIQTTACELDLPSTMKIHNVFHVSLLEPYIASSSLCPPTTAPDPVIIEDEQEYIVSDILDSRKLRNKLHYLVHWEGYPVKDRSWEPAANLANSQDLVQQFHLDNPLRPGPSSLRTPTQPR